MPATGPGTDSCACNAGYSGNGTTCSPINSCATNNGGCSSHATCTSTGPGTNSCACNSGYVGNGTTCTVAFALSGKFPSSGSNLSGSGGYVVLLMFNSAYTLSGTGTATLYDLTAGTSITITAGQTQNWGSTSNLALYVDNGATHSPAHTYAVEVTSDFVVGWGRHQQHVDLDVAPLRPITP